MRVSCLIAVIACLLPVQAAHSQPAQPAEAPALPAAAAAPAPAPLACVREKDCPGDLTCADHRCVPYAVGLACKRDKDCPGELACLDGRCAPEGPRPLAPAAPSAQAPGSYEPEPPLPPPPPPPPPGWAAPPRESTVHRHLGFYLRFDLGLGYENSAAGSGGYDASYTGAAGTFGVHLGGAVRENVVLAAHLFDTVISSPNANTTTPTGVATSQQIDNASLVLFGIGPELTFYSSTNAYVSFTAAFTSLSLNYNNSSSNSSDGGLGARVALGKEWWASDHWGLGFCGQLTLSTNSHGSNSTSETTWLASVAFSATYN